MEIDIAQVAALLWLKLSQFFAGSILFMTIKFFLLVYVIVLFVDIVLLLILKGLSSDLKAVLYGAERPLISQNTLIKRWEAIRDRLESSNPSQYKVAVLEADALANEILDGIGHKGESMTAKLEGVRGKQLETKDLLAEAHAVRNRIVHDATLVLSKEEAERYLQNYQQFFDEVELF